MKRHTTEYFINRAKSTHGDKYDYSLVQYINTDEVVVIACPIHGVYKQTPFNHLKGYGCKPCGLSHIGESAKIKKLLEKSKLTRQLIENGRLVPITRGKFAIVDEEDYERVVQHNWSLTSSPSNHTEYASANHIGKMHRFIIQAPKGVLVDHINHNGLDNRKSNLRLCTKQQNAANSFSKLPSKSSKYKGVTWDKVNNKWATRISKNGKTKTIGRFLLEDCAAKAYNEKAVELFGEFAYLNKF